MKSEKEIRQRIEQLESEVSDGVDYDKLRIEELYWVLETDT